MDVPLEILAREVARAAARIREARAALRRGEAPEGENPLADDRRVSSRATYLELLPPEPPKGRPEPGAPPFAPPANPLRDALREWLYALTLERVLWDDAVRLETARRDASILIDHADLGRQKESPRALLHRILVEPAPGRRRL